MNTYIDITNLNKDIKGNKILNNISLKLEKGNIYGFIGRNGSGKTVLFKCISGLAYPSSGEIHIDNIKLEKGMFPKNLGIIIETPGFIPNISGLDNLKILAEINNVISTNEIIEYMQLVGLDPHNKKKVKNYSLGMKQRLGIAQAIMENPELLILDEPFNSLDKESVKLIKDILLDLHKKGVTILITSHIQEDINDLCNIIYEIDNGEIINNFELKTIKMN